MAVDSGRRYRAWILGLLALFALRVVGQLIQMIAPTDRLPALDDWQGSAIPYGVLLGTQLSILAAGGLAAVRIGRGSWAPNRRLGRGLLLLGTLYFLVMLVRLILGLTVLAAQDWFARPIPAAFHLVLAGMILTIGAYHRRGA